MIVKFRELYVGEILILGRRQISERPTRPFVKRNELRHRSREVLYFYFGLSRCTTFTLYPAFRSRLLTSSAIITERCCPPVHPKLMVK